ncbi:hypothetical protein EVA_22157 [gut metagenome]|uniref:Uncharacterized protein n=1 Tax=gut metagenome TaxID=749906 RepID=J9F4A8_9ZZZZ
MHLFPTYTNLILRYELLHINLLKTTIVILNDVPTLNRICYALAAESVDTYHFLTFYKDIFDTTNISFLSIDEELVDSCFNRCKINTAIRVELYIFRLFCKIVKNCLYHGVDFGDTTFKVRSHLRPFSLDLLVCFCQFSLSNFDLTNKAFISFVVGSKHGFTNDSLDIFSHTFYSEFAIFVESNSFVLSSKISLNCIKTNNEFFEVLIVNVSNLEVIFSNHELSCFNRCVELFQFCTELFVSSLISLL